MDHWWSLAADVVSARVLAWIATWGRDAELTEEAHLYFFDRYRQLAEYHRAHGRPERAQRLEAKAAMHHRRGGLDDPAPAAAMAMPRPARWVKTTAVSGHGFDDPDDAA
jgi:hypothetical protein